MEQLAQSLNAVLPIELGPEQQLAYSALVVAQRQTFDAGFARLASACTTRRRAAITLQVSTLPVLKLVNHLTCPLQSNCHLHQ